MRIELLASFFIIGVFFVQISNAQFTQISSSAGLAGIKSVTLSDNAIVHNPAGIVLQEKFMSSVLLSNLYSLRELNAGSMAIKYAPNNSGAGLYAMNFGNSVFRSSIYGFSYGILVTEGSSLGVRLKYVHANYLSNDFYTEPKRFLADIGTRIKIQENIFFGTFIENLSGYKSNEVILPLTFNVGISYMPSKYLTTFVEISKDIFMDPTLKLALEFVPNNTFFIRGGFMIHPSMYTLGFGYKHTRWKFDVSLQNHVLLGNSFFSGIHYFINK